MIPHEGQRIVDNAFIASIILIDKQLLPSIGQRSSIDSETVVLSSDVAATQLVVGAGLVVPSVTIPIRNKMYQIKRQSKFDLHTIRFCASLFRP